MNTTPIPEYKKPPVSEVALSVLFAPLEKWRSAHAGIFWSKIMTRYPATEVQMPIHNQIETFDGEPRPRALSMRVELPNPDAQRYWFLSDPATRLVQVQRDRFTINWRQVTGDEKYPRYATDLRPRFSEEWTTFVEFLKERDIGVPEILQCELFYINDIRRGDGWNDFKDALPLFAPWWGKGSDGFLPKPEALQISGDFPMPNKSGRLSFTAQRVLRTNDNVEAIQLQLFAKGKPKSSSTEDILTWMDSGREWIVRGFTDLTSAQAHKIWERTQ